MSGSPQTPTLPADIAATVAAALAEDLGTGDLTAALIAESMQCAAHVVAKEAATLCGTAWFDEVFRQLDPTIVVAWRAQDGDGGRSRHGHLHG